MAIIGWLMFGDFVQDEITANILTVTNYPKALSVCIIVFISIIPLTKVPLK
jgi:vesicular inhibitory amino acid transporter